MAESQYIDDFLPVTTQDLPFLGHLRRDIGTILPFSFNQELDLIVDPSLLDVAFDQDYIALAKPRIERIAAYRGSSPDEPVNA